MIIDEPHTSSLRIAFPPTLAALLRDVCDEHGLEYSEIVRQRMVAFLAEHGRDVTVVPQTRGWKKGRLRGPRAPKNHDVVAA